MSHKKFKLETVVKGLQYRVLTETIRIMSDVTPLEARIEREPSNTADENAVKVVLCVKPWEDFHIGYLSRAVAAELAPKLDSGELRITQAVVTALDHEEGEGEILLKGVR